MALFWKVPTGSRNHFKNHGARTADRIGARLVAIDRKSHGAHSQPVLACATRNANVFSERNR